MNDVIAEVRLLIIGYGESLITAVLAYHQHDLERRLSNIAPRVCDFRWPTSIADYPNKPGRCNCVHRERELMTLE